MRALLQLDLHGLHLMHQLVNQLLLATRSISASLIAGTVAAASLILQTAKIVSNALQKINVITQLKQTNKQGNKHTIADDTNSVLIVWYCDPTKL